MTTPYRPTGGGPTARCSCLLACWQARRTCNVHCGPVPPLGATLHALRHPALIPHPNPTPTHPPSLCSITPTFAACAVFVNNARWDGVPFLLKAGKALQSRVAEIRVQFRHVPGNLYRNKLGLDLDKATNELVGGLWWCCGCALWAGERVDGGRQARQAASEPGAARRACFAGPRGRRHDGQLQTTHTHARARPQ